MLEGTRPPALGLSKSLSPTWRSPAGHPSLRTASRAAGGGPVARQAEQSRVGIVRRAQAG